MSDLRKFHGLLKAHIVACARLGVDASRAQVSEHEALKALMELCSETQILGLEIINPEAAAEVRRHMAESLAEDMGPTVGGMQ